MVFQFSWDILKERRNLVLNFNVFFKVYWCLLYLFLAGKENEREKESWVGWTVHKISLNLPKQKFYASQASFFYWMFKSDFQLHCFSLLSYVTLKILLPFVWLERVKCFLNTSIFVFHSTVKESQQSHINVKEVWEIGLSYFLVTKNITKNNNWDGYWWQREHQ